MTQQPIATPLLIPSHYSFSPTTSKSSDHEHDENNFSLQNNRQWTTTTTTTPRESAQSPQPIGVSGSSGTPGKLFPNKANTSSSSTPLKSSPKGPFVSTAFNQQQHIAAAEGWITKPGSPGLPPRKQFVESSPATSPSSFQMMREPIAISNSGPERHLNQNHHGVVENNRTSTSTNTNTSQDPQVEIPGAPAAASDLVVESAMTAHARRSRNPTEAGVVQDSALRFTMTQGPPRHDLNTPRGGNMEASPSYRNRQQQQQQQQQQQPQQQQHVLARDNHSVGSGSVPLPASNADWQWGKRSDPDDQEQALFEQRLCEDAYGVAVRKINQNGKSNLRYVKCCLVEIAELEELAASSSRSVSSRSRGAFSRLRGDRERSEERRGSTTQYDAERTLLKGQKKRVLTWGKKKDVKLPLEKFVCVRKGKTTDRARRNTNPSSRILSLITDDPYHSSLDIEAPTKLDRDKFAKAFSKFLNVPLEGDDNMSTSARSADRTPQSKDGRKIPFSGSNSLRGQRSAASSQADVVSQWAPPKVTTTTTTTTKEPTPLPVVSTALSTEGSTRHLQIEIGNDEKTPQHTVSSPQLAKVAQEAASMHSSVPDPQMASLPSSNMEFNSIQHPPSSLNDHDTGRTSTRSQPPPSERKGQHHHHHHEQQEDAAEEGTVVSSLTGAGFDQEIVEELHLALTELKQELEESRAEAARAVKVAEQAIQSAENSSSKDWNSTVTHKAAEAAALAQKKSAEAMAKQRLAEERLEGERRNASFWRKQAETAEEEAGALQTRAAAAEVQRAAMTEALENERRKGSALVGSMKQRYSSTGLHQKENLEATMERNRQLEVELETARRAMAEKGLQASLEDDDKELGSVASAKKKLYGRIKDDGASRTLLSVNSRDSTSSDNFEIRPSFSHESPKKSSASAPDVVRIYSEFTTFRQQFELLKKATADELKSLPRQTAIWAEQATQAVAASQDEIQRLRTKLAMESATRRKLLNEVQDLRGAVRVYCRPRPVNGGVSAISISSRELLLLHRERAGFKDVVANNTPLSFEFDGIFDSDMRQDDIYNELEEVCLGVLDGFNVCIMAYGQTGCGKTHTMIGDVGYSSDHTASISNHGVHLQATQQLFSVVKHRNERYQDVVTFTIVEVDNERLCDLIAGTDIGEARGRLTVEDARPGARKSNRSKRADSEDIIDSQPGSVSSKPTKLEIKTNHNGETIVAGLLSIEVSSFEEVHEIWKACLRKRASRLAEQGVDLAEHEANSHVIATIKIASTNISTGIGSTGKIQFVDLAGSNVTPRRPTSAPKKASTPEAMFAGVGNNKEWKFTNKSMTTLSEVVYARSQYSRSVPYRNSTLTHLLSDSLEADTKVVMVACVSSDLKDLQETACTLRFAQKMKKIIVGKATKHTLTHA